MALSFAECAGVPRRRGMGLPSDLEPASGYVHVQTTKPGTTVFSKPVGVVDPGRRSALTRQVEELEFLAANPRSVHPRALASKTWELRRKLLGTSDWSHADYSQPRMRYDTSGDLKARVAAVERRLGIDRIAPKYAQLYGFVQLDGFVPLEGMGSTPSWGARYRDPVKKLAACIHVALCNPNRFCCPPGTPQGTPYFRPPKRRPPRTPPPRVPPPRVPPPRVPPPIPDPPPRVPDPPPFMPPPPEQPPETIYALPRRIIREVPVPTPQPELVQLGPVVERIVPGAPPVPQEQIVVGNNSGLPSMPPAPPAPPAPRSGFTPYMPGATFVGAPQTAAQQQQQLVQDLQAQGRARLRAMQSAPWGGGGGGTSFVAGMGRFYR